MFVHAPNMENITMREFRANLSHYMELLRCDAILKVNGMEIQKVPSNRVHAQQQREGFASVLDKPVYTPSSRTLLDQKRVDENRTEKTKLEETISEKGRCQKCTQNPALFQFFQDGEDYQVCMACIKKYNIRNFKPL